MKMRKLFFLLIALVMVVAQPVSVLAQTNGTSVVNSGDNADVDSSSTQTTSINVVNNNQAQVSQSVNASANTGGNSADGNIALNGAGATINTGAAAVSSALSVDVNHNMTAIAAPDMGGSLNSTDVVNTGDDADIDTSTNTSTTIGVSNSNSAYVNQMVSAKANTGKNSADDNIGGAAINTGAAAVGSNLGVVANKNTTAIGSGMGASLLNNPMPGTLTNGTQVTNTGDDADIDTSANSSTSVGVMNSNMAMISQMVWGYANTGKNSAEDNIGGAAIGTGPASVGTVLGVNANHNLTGISGFGLFPTTLNLHDIVNTGDDLDSDATTTTATTVGTENINVLTACQTLWSMSNSGWNYGHDNIGAALLGTGAAGVGANYLLGGNLNTTLLGNVMGLWGSLFS